MTKTWAPHHGKHASFSSVGLAKLYGAHSMNAWWNDRRKSQLAYVMAKFNDLDKAARVTGATRNICWREWQAMHKNRSVAHYVAMYEERKAKEAEKETAAIKRLTEK